MKRTKTTTTNRGFGKTEILPKIYQKFTDLTEMDRSMITVNTSLFQGRATPFSQNTVNKILREGYDKSDSPIIVWYDPELLKHVILSGHSRFEASRILYERGDKRLRTLPVRVFIGEKDDAILYATFESNRSGDNEGFKSDMKKFREGIDKGLNKDYIKTIFKPESYLNELQNLYYLSENGLFYEHLGEPSEKSFPYLRRNAIWVGMLRKEYTKLTDIHEREMFDFFYRKDASKLKLSKNDFFNLIYKKVQSFDFNPERLLNLMNTKDTDINKQSPGRRKLYEINQTIEDFQRERANKEELIPRAMQAGNFDLVEKFQNKISDLNRAIVRKMQERIKLEQELLIHEDKDRHVDLFAVKSVIETPQEVKTFLKIQNFKTVSNLLKKELKLLKKFENLDILEGLEYYPETVMKGFGRAEEGKTVYQIITDLILTKIQTDGLVWRKSWSSTNNGMPAINFVSKKPYRGINAFILNYFMRSNNPYYLTFKQIQDLKGKIKKGATSVPVVFYTSVYKDEKTNQTITIEEAKERNFAGVLYIPILRYYRVFNGDFIEGIDWKLPEPEQKPEFETIDACEQIVANMPLRPKIIHEGSSASYNSGSDEVHMPKPNFFDKEQE